MLEAFVMGVGVVATAAAMLFVLSIVATIADALTKGKNEKDNAA